MAERISKKYQLTDEERTYLADHNGFDLGGALLAEDDPEGPAHREFRKFVELETKATMGGLIALAQLHSETKRREQRKAFWSKIPGIRRLVKKGD